MERSSTQDCLRKIGKLIEQKLKLVTEESNGFPQNWRKRREEGVLSETSSKQGGASGDRAGTAPKKKQIQNVLTFKCLIPFSYLPTGGREWIVLIVVKTWTLGPDCLDSNPTQILTFPASLNKLVTSLSFGFHAGEMGTIISPPSGVVLKIQWAGTCTKYNVCKAWHTVSAMWKFANIGCNVVLTVIITPILQSLGTKSSLP